ncbi:hypothetical protein C7B61_03805 [filamentous cyanobacterium CCP1]|nr:hypothetical protein C7B76_04710 [filamentous cyanobacterium CCP2]PSB67881.1 hypothetical protein C7B61_03805 [filamentous cyanobacterium CCP1]
MAANFVRLGNAGEQACRLVQTNPGILWLRLELIVADRTAPITDLQVVEIPIPPTDLQEDGIQAFCFRTG